MENLNDEKINENINNLNNNQNLPQDDKVEIIGVKFEQNGKTYYFSPGTNKYNKGEKVIVEKPQNGLESEGYLITYVNGVRVKSSKIRTDKYKAVRGKVVIGTLNG